MKCSDNMNYLIHLVKAIYFCWNLSQSSEAAKRRGLCIVLFVKLVKRVRFSSDPVRYASLKSYYAIVEYLGKMLTVAAKEFVVITVASLLVI